MKHIDQFETHDMLNEEASALGSMPAFLKSIKAKPATFRLSQGAWLSQGKPKTENNCWKVELPSPLEKDKTVNIHFFPDGNFIFTTKIGSGGKFEGKWRTGSSSDFFQFGDSRNGIKIPGVQMQFTLFGGLVTIN